MPIRPYRETDLDLLHAANVASVPGVGAATRDELQTWIDLSTCFVATTETDEPLGFITLIPTGVHAYESANLRWFEQYSDRTGKAVIYVDRIALLPEARGQRLGEKLYQAAFAHFANLDEIGCEVNTLPPNPGSHRFHQRLGFDDAGTQVFVPGEKAVTYYVRPLK
ncbi:MAG: GNAT family N-acetyltransferase [Pseudomonadota bacterium]